MFCDWLLVHCFSDLGFLAFDSRFHVETLIFGRNVFTYLHGAINFFYRSGGHVADICPAHFEGSC